MQSPMNQLQTHGDQHSSKLTNIDTQINTVGANWNEQQYDNICGVPTLGFWKYLIPSYQDLSLHMVQHTNHASDLSLFLFFPYAKWHLPFRANLCLVYVRRSNTKESHWSISKCWTQRLYIEVKALNADTLFLAHCGHHHTLKYILMIFV